MEFCYFRVDEQYTKPSLLHRFFRITPSKVWVQNKFIRPLKQTSLTLFHLHEIKGGLFHIVFIAKEKQGVFNFLYDAKQQLFFFEKETGLLDEIQKSTLWRHLSEVSPPSNEYQLYTVKDISDILNK